MSNLSDYEQEQILAFVRKFGTPSEIGEKIDRLERLLSVEVELVQIGMLSKSKGMIKKHFLTFWVLVTSMVASIVAIIANAEKILGFFR